jgi:hypothetical protein
LELNTFCRNFCFFQLFTWNPFAPLLVNYLPGTFSLYEIGRPLSRNLSDEHWKDFTHWKWQWLSHKYMASNLGFWFPGHE